MRDIYIHDELDVYVEENRQQSTWPLYLAI